LLRCGDTFLIPKRGSEAEHLWIVITEPDENGQAVCVNITSRNNESDTTVVLRPGDHSFVKKESVVYYVDAQVLDLAKVAAAIKAKPRSYVCTLHDSCEPELLARIQEGLQRSPFCPNGIKDLCRKRWGTAS
jgi:hypothetical protein